MKTCVEKLDHDKKGRNEDPINKPGKQICFFWKAYCALRSTFCGICRKVLREKKERYNNYIGFVKLKYVTDPAYSYC